MIKSLYKFILLLILFNFINLQESSTKLNLDEIVSGKLEKDGSLDYYILNLPDYIPENNLLVFTAEENKVSLNKEEEILSDPDIYISKKNLHRIKSKVIGIVNVLEMILLQYHMKN